MFINNDKHMYFELLQRKALYKYLLLLCVISIIVCVGDMKYDDSEIVVQKARTKKCGGVVCLECSRRKEAQIKR